MVVGYTTAALPPPVTAEAMPIGVPLTMEEIARFSVLSTGAATVKALKAASITAEMNFKFVIVFVEEKQKSVRGMNESE